MTGRSVLPGVPASRHAADLVVAMHSQARLGVVVQQGRNFLQHAEDVDLPVEIVMRDNDGKYPAQFDEVLKSGCASIKRNTPWSPNLRAHVERVIQTLKQGVLDHFVIVAERHLNYITRNAMAWYNKDRPHSARDHLPPACETPPEPRVSLKSSEVACTTRIPASVDFSSPTSAAQLEHCEISRVALFAEQDPLLNLSKSARFGGSAILNRSRPTALVI